MMLQFDPHQCRKIVAAGLAQAHQLAMGQHECQERCFTSVCFNRYGKGKV